MTPLISPCAHSHTPQAADVVPKLTVGYSMLHGHRQLACALCRNQRELLACMAINNQHHVTINRERLMAKSVRCYSKSAANYSKGGAKARTTQAHRIVEHVEEKWIGGDRTPCFVLFLNRKETNEITPFNMG